MEETIINEPTLFQVLVSSPTTYVFLLVIVLTIIGLKMEKSSPKCCEPNKTSSSSKPKRARGKKGKYLADDPKTAKNEAWKGGKAPKKKATKKAPAKKAPAKKTPAKKAVKKRTPKKGGK
jgi:hypothetical protein